jgi:hypothetical protein
MRCFTGLLVRSRFVVALSIALPILIGCTGSTSKPFGKLVPVKGKVTYNGKPAPAGCIITFFHSERNFPASAQIAADGTYTLLFNGKPEVPVGNYKVSVTSHAAEAAPVDQSNPEAYKAMMMKTGISKGDGQAKVATIPNKYATPEASGVTFSVIEGQTTYDLDMKD